MLEEHSDIRYHLLQEPQVSVPQKDIMPLARTVVPLGQLAPPLDAFLGGLFAHGDIAGCQGLSLESRYVACWCVVCHTYTCMSVGKGQLI